jgi:hypothetical protein
MKTQTIRLASLTMVLVFSVMSSAWAQQVRLSARKNKIINGIEAELRGDYRAKANGSPIRLNSELDNINIPVGTPVAFCLLQNGVKTLLGVGQVALVGGIPVASVELTASDGDVVPTVGAGDVVQARQRKVAPFKTNPTCGTAVLVPAAFQ